MPPLPAHERKGTPIAKVLAASRYPTRSTERNSNSVNSPSLQLLVSRREKIPYFLDEVQRFGEKRARENERRPEAGFAIRFGPSKPLRKQRDDCAVR
jgi:hypothetical protein